MKEAAGGGERCPHCGYTSGTTETAKSGETPAYALRLAALRYGATDARTVWVEKQMVGTVEQFARKWRALDETGAAIANGEVSLEAAVGKLLKARPYTSNADFEAKHPRGQGGQFANNPQAARSRPVVGGQAFGRAAQQQRAFDPDEAAMNAAYARQERESEERGFASDPDYQRSLAGSDAKARAAALDEYNTAVSAYNDLVQTGGIIGRSKAWQKTLRAAENYERLTGHNPMDGEAVDRAFKSGTSNGNRLGWQKRRANAAVQPAADEPDMTGPERDAEFDHAGHQAELDQRGWKKGPNETDNDLHHRRMRAGDSPTKAELAQVDRDTKRWLTQRQQARKIGNLVAQSDRKARKDATGGQPIPANRDLPQTTWEQLGQESTTMNKAVTAPTTDTPGWAKGSLAAQVTRRIKK